MQAEFSTHEKILHTAVELFLKEGPDKVSIRDIAKAANVNLALINYYFKSKENLLNEIVSYLLERVIVRRNSVLNNLDLKLEAKLKLFIDSLIDDLIENKDIVAFFITTLYTNPHFILNNPKKNILLELDPFFNHLKKEMKAHTIKWVNPPQFYVNMLSLCYFPFLISPLIAERSKMTKSKLNAFIRARKEIVFNTLLLELGLVS